MDCIVRKLKAVINNDSLQTLNRVTFDVPSTSNPGGRFVRLGGDAYGIKIGASSGGGWNNAQGVAFTLPYEVKSNHMPFYVAPSSGYVGIIDNANHLTHFEASQMGVFMKNLNMDALLASPLKDIRLTKDVTFAKDYDFAEFTNLSQLEMASLSYASNIKCSDLSKLVTNGGVSVNHGSVILSLFLRNVGGSIESFVSALRAKGETAGSFKMRVFGTDSTLTYNGTRITPSTSSADEVTYTFTYTASTISCDNL